MYYFIVNPNSRTGLGMQLWREAELVLQKEQVPYRVFFTGHSSHASEITREISEKGAPCTIVILGGDGTVNEVMQGISHPELITLGYIPIGSGNDFARDYRLPLHPEQALDNILHPKQTALMDIGCISASGQTRYFAGSSGMGFDAAICLEAQDSRIKRVLNRLKLGSFTYVSIALHQLFSFRPFKASVLLDETETLTLSNAYFISVMNQPYEGGGLKLAPDTDGCDGLLDVCIIHRLPKLLLPFLLPTAFFGKHTVFRRYVDIRRCRTVTLQAASPAPVHSDGESFGYHKKITVRTSGSRIRIITGPDFPAQELTRSSEIFQNNV